MVEDNAGVSFHVYWKLNRNVNKQSNYKRKLRSPCIIRRDSMKRYQADRYITENSNHSNSYTCARFQNRTSLLQPTSLSLSETAYLSLELSLLEFR